MKKIVIPLVLMGILCLVGCSKTPFNNINSSEIKNIDYLIYEGLLEEAADGTGEHCTYSIYDINNDGKNELILKVGICEADFIYYFYGLNEELNILELGQYNGSHGVLYANENGKGIILVSGTQGYQTITNITMDNDFIKTEIVFEGDICDGEYYKNSSPLSVCYVTDINLLKKDAQLIGKELEYDEGSLEPDNSSSFSTLPISMNIIDMEFELACKKANGTVMEVHTDNIRNIPIELTPEQKLYCIFGNTNEYLIVEDGIIVGYITYNGSVTRDMSMKQYFPTDDCYSVDPQIAWNDSYAYCCWKTENSYMILGAITNPSSDITEYYNWSTTTLILIKDLSQFTFNSQIQ